MYRNNVFVSIVTIRWRCGIDWKLHIHVVILYRDYVIPQHSSHSDVAEG